MYRQLPCQCFATHAETPERKVHRLTRRLDTRSDSRPDIVASVLIYILKSIFFGCTTEF
jgi:hypothetical protein